MALKGRKQGDIDFHIKETPLRISFIMFGTNGLLGPRMYRVGSCSLLPDSDASLECHTLGMAMR